jgi:hypothetical protein
MLNSTYTPDFSFLLTNHWNEPDKPPRINNKTLSTFLNETLEAISSFTQRTLDNETLKELSDLSGRIRWILPEISMLTNVSNTIRLLDPGYQWANYDEYREQKMQNENCYKEKVSAF